MKLNAVLSCLCAWILGALLSFAALGCLVTGFDLEAGSLGLIFVLCAIFSALGAVCFRFRWGGAALFACLAAAVFFLCRKEAPVDQTLWLIEHISRVYDKAYHWGYLSLGGSHGGIYPLAALGCLIALTVSGSVTKGISALPAATASLLPLFLCLVVTDTVPDGVFLFLLLAGIGILVLTASSRHRSEEQGNLLTALVAAPVVIAAALLLLLNPKENYANRLPDVQQLATQWLEKLPQRLLELPEYFEEMNAGGRPALPDDQVNRVDLSKVGPQTQSQYPVMDVLGTVEGPLYLRGQDFDLYSGTGWQSSSRQTEPFPGTGAVLTYTGNLTVETRRLRDVQYLPYYPVTGKNLLSGRLYNTAGLHRYTVSVGILREDWRGCSLGMPGVELTAAQRRCEEQAQSLYLGLPEQTRQQAQELLEVVLANRKSRTEQAEAIRTLVRSAARYDLDTPSMPRDAEDFALWFLQESETGYCVHFATAATVLLRAAGIPARYVTGYLTTAVPGQTVTVTAEDAHAWAEYYEPALDAWIVLEATPAAEAPEEPQETSEPTEPEATETVEQTEPSSTQSTETAPGESEAPETQPEPSGTEPAGSGEPEAPTAVPRWLTALVGWTLALAAAVLMIREQRMIRVAAKRRRLREGEPNDQALRRWREVVLLARLRGQGKPPRELERLAQKAKYSQHTLTGEELETLSAYLEESREDLKTHPWYRQIVYQYLYALY